MPLFLWENNYLSGKFQRPFQELVFLFEFGFLELFDFNHVFPDMIFFLADSIVELSVLSLQCFDVYGYLRIFHASPPLFV